MFYKHFYPITPLRPYIECFWIIVSSADAAITHRARMPADSRATLLLNFVGEPRIVASDGTLHYIGRGANILGVRTQSYILEHNGDTHLIAAQFRPGGFASFTRYGIGELAEQTTPLDLLWGNTGNWLCEQIYGMNADLEKLALYQNELLKRFVEMPQQLRIQHALAQIDDTRGNISVESLAAQANLSQKQFERQFERVVGMMPKRYIRLARFQRLVNQLTRRGSTVNWTKVAAQFGYYDHSHLAKDFRAFVGTTPSEFAAATAGIVEVAYGHPGESQEV